MARSHPEVPRRRWKTRIAVGGTLVSLLGAIALPAGTFAHAAAPGIRTLNPGAADVTSLEQAYAAGRHIPLWESCPLFP